MQIWKQLICVRMLKRVCQLQPRARECIVGRILLSVNDRRLGLLYAVQPCPGHFGVCRMRAQHTQTHTHNARTSSRSIRGDDDEDDDGARLSYRTEFV